MKKLLLSLLLVCIAVLDAAAGDTARVLFIGNTFSTGLPQAIASLAASNGDVLISVNPQISSTQTLQSASTDANTLSAIDAGGYNYLVLQEQGSIPSLSDAQVATDFYPYAKALVDRMRLNSPCSKPMLFMTWGYRNGDVANCPSFPRVCTYGGMDSLLRNRYMIAADSNNALLCPASGVWLKIRTTYPHINAYAADNQNASASGLYANACAFYAAIFGKNPVGLSYNGPFNTLDAGRVQAIAKEVVFDSLNYWRHWWTPTFPAKARFSFSASDWTVQFTSSSVNAAKHIWLFGDGTQDTAQNPTHTYTAGQPYAVRLVVESICGERDTIDKAVLLGAAAVGSTNAVESVPVVAPNPAVGELHFSGLAGRYTRLQLSDISGRILQTTNIPASAGNYTVRISGLPSGMYLATLIRPSGERLLLKWRKD